MNSSLSFHHKNHFFIADSTCIMINFSFFVLLYSLHSEQQNARFITVVSDDSTALLILLL